VYLLKRYSPSDSFCTFFSESARCPCLSSVEKKLSFFFVKNITGFSPYNGLQWTPNSFKVQMTVSVQLQRTLNAIRRSKATAGSGLSENSCPGLHTHTHTHTPMIIYVIMCFVLIWFTDYFIF